VQHVRMLMLWRRKLMLGSLAAPEGDRGTHVPVTHVNTQNIFHSMGESLPWFMLLCTAQHVRLSPGCTAQHVVCLGRCLQHSMSQRLCVPALVFSTACCVFLPWVISKHMVHFVLAFSTCGVSVLAYVHSCLSRCDAHVCTS
jgi:hypothetical protein